MSSNSLPWLRGRVCSLYGFCYSRKTKGSWSEWLERRWRGCMCDGWFYRIKWSWESRFKNKLGEKCLISYQLLYTANHPKTQYLWAVNMCSFIVLSCRYEDLSLGASPFLAHGARILWGSAGLGHLCTLWYVVAGLLFLACCWLTTYQLSFPRVKDQKQGRSQLSRNLVWCAGRLTGEVCTQEGDTHGNPSRHSIGK